MEESALGGRAQGCAVEGGAGGGAGQDEGSNGRSSPTTGLPQSPQQHQHQHQHQHKDMVKVGDEEDEQGRQRKRARGNASTSATVIVIDDSSDEEGREETPPAAAAPPAAAQAVMATASPMLPLSSISLSSRPHHPRLHAILASLTTSTTSSSNPTTTPIDLPSLIVVDLDYTLWKGNVSDQLPPFTPGSHPDHVHVRGVYNSTGWGGGKGGGGGGGGASLFRLFPEAREVLSALHSTGTTTLAVASRSPNTQAAVHMLRVMKLHVFFISSFSSSSSSSSSFSSSTSSSTVTSTSLSSSVEGGREGGREGEVTVNARSEEALLMHISNEGFGKTTHLREILRTAKAEPHQVLFFDDQRGNIQDARKLGCCAQSVTTTEGLSWAALESGLRRYREESRARRMMARHFAVKKK